MESYQLASQPFCKKEAVVIGDYYRFSILTPALIRMEYSKSGVFEDHATQTVLNRDFPVPGFRVEERAEEILICTDFLELHYDRKEFSPEGLWVKVSGEDGREKIWHYGDVLQDLKGTVRIPKQLMLTNQFY